jgi:hypothetical protein
MRRASRPYTRDIGTWADSPYCRHFSESTSTRFTTVRRQSARGTYCIIDEQ